MIKTLFKFIYSGIKVYSKIGHYFPNKLIIDRNTYWKPNNCV